MHADLYGHKTSVMSEYTLPTTLTTILVVTCICHTHVVESHLSSARLGEEAHSIDIQTLPEQSAVFTHSNGSFSSLQAEGSNVCRLMVRTFLAVFCISPKGDPGKLLGIYLT